MQSFETYKLMWEHLELFFVSGLFAPPVWLMAGLVYCGGWITGRVMRGKPIGTVFILFYLGACAFAFLVKSSGWDLLILGGTPFILGVYVGKKVR